MKFEKLLERATSKDNLEPDWEAILLCVDALRSGEIQAKPALLLVEKRYHGDNPHSAHHALLVLEALVKNCGPKVHVEVASKESMEDLKHLAACSNEKVKNKILELLQCWAFAFRDKPEYSIVKDTVQIMKLEGFQFPTLREAEAMFDAESAPDWVDSEHCNRCKVAFGLLTRKHHCRNCGQIFCDRCSSRSSIIPKYGIEKEVRVCETCFDKLKGRSKEQILEQSKAVTESQAKPLDPEPAGTTAKPAATNKDGKTEAEIREEEELQLALALSQSEAEDKARKKRGFYSFDISGATPAVSTAPTATENTPSFYKGAMDNSQQLGNKASTINDVAATSGTGDGDSELARYLNRDYWEQRQKDGPSPKPSGGILRSSPTPSAPFAEAKDEEEPKPKESAMVNGDTGGPMVNGVRKEDELLQNGEAAEMDEFTKALGTNIDVFVNRIRSNQARGRSVYSDTSLQSLFMSLTAQHSELLKHLHDLDDRRGYFEGLHDKLQQIKDAREAVDALRLEHSQQRQQELMEQQRIRQIQMVQKLEVMRQQKHEYLEHQRLMAIQRMQQQEQEMLMRKQQQQAMLANLAAQGGGSYAGQAPGIAGQWHQQPHAPGMPPMAPGGNAYGMQGMANALPQQQHQQMQYNQQQYGGDSMQQHQQPYVAQNPQVVQQSNQQQQQYLPAGAQQSQQHSAGSIDYGSYQAGGASYQQQFPPVVTQQNSYPVQPAQPQQPHYDPQSTHAGGYTLQPAAGQVNATAGGGYPVTAGNYQPHPSYPQHGQQQPAGLPPAQHNAAPPGSPYQQYQQHQQQQPVPQQMPPAQQQQYGGNAAVAAAGGQYPTAQGYAAAPGSFTPEQLAAMVPPSPATGGMMPQQHQQIPYVQAQTGGVLIGGNVAIQSQQQAAPIVSPTAEPLISFD